MQVRAIAEAARSRGLAHLSERTGKLRRSDCAKAKLGDSGAVYKEAGRHAVESRRGGRLPPGAETRDLAHDRLASQRAEDRTLPDPGDAAEECLSPFDRRTQFFDTFSAFGVDDDDGITKGAVEIVEGSRVFGGGQIRLCEHDQRPDIFELGESEKLIECEEARSGIRQRGYRYHRIHVRRHGFRASFNGAASQREGSGKDRGNENPSIFEKKHFDAVARCEHLAFDAALGTFERGDPRVILRIEHDPCSVFTYGNDARREGLAHAANDALIVKWARTLRIDAPPAEALKARLVEALAHDGVTLEFGAAGEFGRMYALVQGPEGVDPAALEQLVPEGIWYPQAVIVLAIEPVPADALPQLLRALGGPGAPAGVACEAAQGRLLLEIAPSAAQPVLVLRTLDVELRRFGGYRRTQLLSPLSAVAAAACAAAGLQAPDVATGRILESLLGIARVE